jgi:predicted transcriptional regulator
MKDINDLIYLSHITKTKQMAKDKKQTKKYRQTALLNDDQYSEEVSEEVIDDLPLIEEENERRAGSDRRKTQQNRGRYIESRLKKNRRYKKEVFIVI